MPNPIALSLVAGCLASLAHAAPTAKASDVPAKLAGMLARYDAMQPGRERDELGAAIDRLAHQRYATVSRLYWHTSLDDAKATARAKQRPILHLRMLGRLDEELSCANSRFFRSTLYANAETAKFLRDNFVLYWSTERPVPRVTIDFGDGRKIVRTTTGNSAHYVMDERGNVLDVLPGLYAPVVFRSELAKSLALAKSVRTLDDEKLLAEVIAFHRAAQEETAQQFAKLAGTDFIRRRGRLVTASEIGPSAIMEAQRATYAKYVAEVPDLQKIGIDAGAIEPSDVGQWATIAQKAWNIGLEDKQPVPRSVPMGPRVLDAQSIALVEKLRAGNPHEGTPQGIHWMIARLEQNILADSALNQFRLRQQIRSRFTTDFDKLNEWIYTRVFHTPKTDAWLGLLDGTDFTALPADGVVH